MKLHPHEKHQSDSRCDLQAPHTPQGDGSASPWTASNYSIHRSTCCNIPEHLNLQKLYTYLPTERNICHSCIAVFCKRNRRLANERWSVWCFLGHAFPIFLGLCVVTLCARNWTKIFSFRAIFSLHKTETEPVGDLSCRLFCCGSTSVENCHREQNPKTVESKISDKMYRPVRTTYVITYVVYWSHLHVSVAFCDHPQGVQY